MIDLCDCPNCKKKAANYDYFEDCYLCLNCDYLFYPHDIGRKDNPEAGIWKLGGVSA